MNLAFLSHIFDFYVKFFYLVGIAQGQDMLPLDVPSDYARYLQAYPGIQEANVYWSQLHFHYQVSVTQGLL